MKVPFRISKYEDEVVCDVVPMQASHLILGRPWQYDKAVHLDGRTNKYSFMHGDKKITLVPLTPRQVHEDQVRLHEEYELECEQKKSSMREQEKGISLAEKEKKKVALVCMTKDELNPSYGDIGADHVSNQFASLVKSDEVDFMGATLHHFEDPYLMATNEQVEHTLKPVHEIQGTTRVVSQLSK